jgi:NitT/TauT family transport system ATP-binding protein
MTVTSQTSQTDPEVLMTEPLTAPSQAGPLAVEAAGTSAPATPVSPGTPAISAAGFSVSYGRGGRDLVALQGLDLTVRKGELVSLIGPSGCGKSTFLKAVADLLPEARTTGALSVNGVSPQEARRRNDFSFVFQAPTLLPWRTVRENVQLPLQVIPKGAARGSVDIDGLLARVGLSDFGDLYPHECSGGMQQRVSIARALTLSPEVLLMDEPFGALDEITREQVNLELLDILGEDGPAVVLVTHSISEAVFLSDRVIVLTGRPGEVRAEIPIDLPKPRVPAVRRSPRFSELEVLVREGLGV